MLKNYSLRGVLLVTLLSASVLIMCITAYKSYKDTRKEIAGLLDAELALSAKVLNDFVKTKLMDGPLSVELAQTKELKIADDQQNKPRRHKGENKVSFQLWTEKDGLIIRSNKAPTFPLSVWREGFSETKIGNHLWHVFSLPADTGEYIIHVAQRHDIRQELTDDISKRLIKPMLIGIPVMGVVIWLIVGRSLRSINQLADEINKRKANKLDPLSTKNLPKEIQPLVSAQNQLFLHVAEAFEKEQRFTADASHELRTPLAGLLAQAQVAMKTEDPQVRQQALSRIEEAVKSMTHLIQQLLTLARIDPSTDFLETQPTNISAELYDVITALERYAYAKQIKLELQEHPSAIIQANPPLINILLRNIVDNAIKYTPEKGRIITSVEQKNQATYFITEDSGEGIPAQLYDQVLDRFYRCVETANTTRGSGLGLSIVNQIAKLHGAEIKLARSQFGGLKFTVVFPHRD